MPWISLADEVRAIAYVLEHDTHRPLNLTAPNPVRNAEFIATLGRRLRRPTVIPAPGFALRLVLGEFASEALTGQRARPAQLLDAGFEFTHESLDEALGWALGR